MASDAISTPPREVPPVSNAVRLGSPVGIEGEGDRSDIRFEPATDEQVIEALGRLAEIGFARWGR